MEIPDSPDVAILAAVLQEIESLFSLLDNARDFNFRGESFRVGSCRNRVLLAGTTGLGKVNAAITTAALLEHFSVAQVWNIGCAGAFSQSPLRVGDVLITQEARCADEGVLTASGPVSAETIGIPILARDGRAWFDRIPVDHYATNRWVQQATPAGRYRIAAPLHTTPIHPEERKTAVEWWEKAVAPIQPAIRERSGRQTAARAEEESFQLFFGPSLTVGMASGDAQVAGERFHRYGTFAENMEGSAVAQACFRFDTPMLECRGISNIAGERRKANWRVKEAMAHCHGIIMNWLMHDG